MFFWSSLAFLMIQWMLAIWSLVALPFLKPAWASESSRFTYCICIFVPVCIFLQNRFLEMELASQRVYAFKIFIDENFILSNYLSKSLSQFIFFLSLCIFKDFWSYCAAYRVLFPQLGFEPVPTVVETWNPNHWIPREVPNLYS